MNNNNNLNQGNINNTMEGTASTFTSTDTANAVTGSPNNESVTSATVIADSTPLESANPKSIEDLKSFEAKSSKIEENEQDLHKPYGFKVIQVEQPEPILVGLDSGSTQNRAIVISKKLNSFTQIVIPSRALKVEQNFNRAIDPGKDNLYDRMDTTIQCQSASECTPSLRVCRGGLMGDYNGTPFKISTTQQKVKTDGFFANIRDSIGYAIAMKYKEIPSKVDVYLCVALPPDEQRVVSLVQEFIKNLKGTYTWTYNPDGISFEISIKRVVTLSEPEAQVKGFYASNRNMQVPERVMHIELGGRNCGLEVLENTKSLNRFSKSCYQGGSQLCSALGEELVQSQKFKRAPKEEILKEALKTGYIVTGSDKVDVIPEIKTAKNSLAEQIYTDIIAVFDTVPDFDIYNLNAFTFGGRTFAAGDYNYSVVKPLVEKLKTDAPNFTPIHITKNYIPLGCIANAAKHFGGILK